MPGGGRLPSLYFLAPGGVSLLLFASFATAWLPPPAEFDDVTDGSGIDFPIHKWHEGLGAASSLLDVLPAGTPAIGDFNRDGLPDVFFTTPKYTDDAFNQMRQPRSRLYMNDGSTQLQERFIDVTDVAGIDVTDFAYSASWGDYNNDAWPDLFVGGYRFARLLRNNQDSTFTDVTTTVGLPQDGLVLGGAWGDYDADGRLDLFLVQFSTYTHPDDGLPDLHDLPGKANVLLRNSGGTAFVDASAASGVAALARRSTSASFVDVDADGRLDLYVTNLGQDAEYWRSNGDGTFTERASVAGIADGADATCQAWEDVDRDGRLDLYVAHEAGTRDGLFFAKADGTFEDRDDLIDGTTAGGGWGCFAFDFDGDGDMDLFAASGGLQGDGTRQRATLMKNRLEENVGLAFEDASAEMGDSDVCGFEDLPTVADPLAMSGAVPYDYSMFGIPAILTTNNDHDQARLFKNVGWACGWGGGNGNFFKIWLEGVASNALGIGAKVTVKAGVLTLVRQVGAGMSWGGQSVSELHFGIWKAEEAGYATEAFPVSVKIEWPSGLVENHVAKFDGFSRTIRFKEGLGWKNDTVAPRPILTLDNGVAGANSWYRSNSVQIVLTCEDTQFGGSDFVGTQSMRYSLDGANWITVTKPTTIGTTLTFTGQGSHRLWVETIDKVGNRAVFLYPIRLDNQAPTGTLVSPQAGGVYVQGREVAQDDTLAQAGRALILAPVPADFGALGEAGSTLDGAVGSDGRQRMVSVATDNGPSGIWKVEYKLVRADQFVNETNTGTARLIPYAWDWPASLTAAGEYRLVARILDFAGNFVERSVKVVVVPTGLEGLKATVDDGPGIPAP